MVGTTSVIDCGRIVNSKQRVLGYALGAFESLLAIDFTQPLRGVIQSAPW